ncbi:MAG: hypothetical protein H0U49_11700 [Parachlamydiaceae bacterium]|nr:hypothetical protein [Parachlamydiaceae bacterium]
MMKLLSLLCLAVGNLCAQEGQMEIESQKCEFDGKKITLNGSISLVHELGKMTADEAVLFANPDEKKLSIGMLKINKNVIITSKEGSQLTCDEALINYKTMQGNFSGADPSAFVTFYEVAKEKSGPILMLKSRSMQAQIARQENTEKGSSTLKEIIALKDVNIEYKDLNVTADKGIYSRTDNPDLSSEGAATLKAIPGTIILSMDQPESYCHVKSAKGDLIQSFKLHIDTAKNEINFLMPQGKVQFQQNTVESSLEFSADNLLWKLNGSLYRPKTEMEKQKSDKANPQFQPSGGILLLSKNVSVDIQNKGTLTTDCELEIHYQNINGKRQLRSIESNGHTTLSSPEKQEGHFHFLYCFGRFFVDHDKMITTFDSPTNEQGITALGKQVVFRDSLGEMHADKLTLYYQNIEGKISPSRLIAEGNVYLLDRKGTPANQDASLIHYALADRVKYEFESKEALFTASKKKRVLFYDKTNNLQISAPALKLKRDGGNNKESIQGIGDVRFSFMENEVQQLKARFETLPHRY